MIDDLVAVWCEIDAPIERVWEAWTTPAHIVRWNAATDEWHTPSAANDLREGGRFSYRMEARDGSVGFDFAGEHREVRPPERIASRLDDGRALVVTFVSHGEKTAVEERFEPDPDQPPELQRQGWQAILDRFKRHVESLEPGR